MSGPTPAIEVHHLTKRFDQLVAVNDIDLEVHTGELFGIIGPNGAGKTTLLRILIGLIPATSGDARVAGVDVRTDPDRVRRMLGVVPQALTSDLDLTGLENMEIYARFFDIGRERHARIEALLRRVGLWDRRDDLVQTYSGGMRRRLEIARGMIHRPKLLFLDEPTIGLDPQSRHVIWELLIELRKGSELTVALTTHYLDEAEALCDRVAIVDQGKVVALGTPAELKSNVPGSETVELGLSPELSERERSELGALAGVREVHPRPKGILVRADGAASLLPRLFEWLREHGHEVTAANVSRISLEDAFIYFTGRSMREEAPQKQLIAPMARRFT